MCRGAFRGGIVRCYEAKGLIVCSSGRRRMLNRLKRLHVGVLALAVAPALAALGPALPAAAAGPSVTSGSPVMAVVSLGRQKVTIYDARGRMLEAPVSTGQVGYETPAGLYSVIERKKHHFSNLYENAPMPFMQRITWSGIALHAGALPGYPASHGCIRLPYDFAGRLFEMSRRGLRVVVARDDVAPVDFAHPALFRPQTPSPGPALSQGQPDARVQAAAFGPQPTRRSTAADKAVAAEAAAERLKQARRALSRAREEAGDYMDKLEVAEAAKRIAEATLREADALLQGKLSARDGEVVKAAKAKAQERLAGAQGEIDAINAAAKARIDAALAARAEAKAAREAAASAEEEAKLAALAPVSVFISRKTQRLYVRQAFEPLFESGVTIRNPQSPIGTTLFTAVGYVGSDTDELRWTALAMYPGPSHRRGEGAPRARQRISIPREALDRINELVSPGSSLIISDESMSRETSKGTDFVVVMSGEPQGGISRRRLRPDVFTDLDDDLPAPSGKGFSFGPFSWW
jgi:L,D-transpeptidase-like protein